MQKKPFSFDRSAFREKITDFLQRLGVDAEATETFFTVFLHRSILNELEFTQSNERLEFL